MSQKKARQTRFKDKTKNVESYFYAYQAALKALVLNLPEERRADGKDYCASFGKCEIWPCEDGVVALIYREQDLGVRVRDPLGKTIDQLMGTGRAFRLFDQRGNECPARPVIGAWDPKFNKVDNSRAFQPYAGLRVERSDGVVFLPKFSRAFIVGWDAELPKPEEEAVEDFQAGFAQRNILGKVDQDVYCQNTGDANQVVLNKGMKLASDFKLLLDGCETEEELQRFLKNNPLLMYPDYIEVYPKLELGAEYVTDFVFVNQGYSGLEHVFVEIESANRQVFTRSGHFHSDYTKAKNQILDWQVWIESNMAYIRGELLPDLNHPNFHLVMGRECHIDKQGKAKLRAEYSGSNRVFSTYDNCLKRFEKILDRIMGIG